MSPPDPGPVSSLEAKLLLAGMILATAWYAVPQVLYSLYPLAEIVWAIFP